MPMVTSPPVQRYMWGTRPSNFSTRGITREESISVDQRITDGEGRGGAVSRLLTTYRFTMPGVKAAKPNLWPPMNADKNQNALSTLIGGSICFSARPPVGRALVRTEDFFCAAVGRHPVFENDSCLSLSLC